ncbi:hypothetical protein C2G38_944897 [Gigaspora rosea]|uniref:TLDc domain-containing protein n=1 Tax=Gigaspora rosea TaxID=44941 RepID=A0A397U458_9GLOM|nr:hypothetical protein C2G38_944897 [Gigaspora rosea]
MVKYPDYIFGSFQENALVSIISRDDLQMDEVKIWNHIIKWGIVQNPDLPTDLEDWSNENFLALKTTLQNCLPHIRYFRMSGDSILNNVKPYHQILEKNVWDDILKMSMTPNQTISSKIFLPRIILTQKLPIRDIDTFSTIINEAHAAGIASWVDKEAITYSVTDNPYEFNLLLRGTRDDFTSDSFWNLCERQTYLVVVMKVKGTDEILNGYNPVGWGNGYYHRACNDSFIFSLKNGAIQNSILSRVIQPEHAIYCNSDSGPCFGGGCDLGMSNNFNQNKTCWSRQRSYGKLIRNESTFHSKGISWFSVEEYEIFQISKKS